MRAWEGVALVLVGLALKTSSFASYRFQVERSLVTLGSSRLEVSSTPGDDGTNLRGSVAGVLGSKRQRFVFGRWLLHGSTIPRLMVKAKDA